MKFFDYDSKFSRFMSRIAELVLLNVLFLLTCIPIFTIGAAVTALYSVTLKMTRKEEGYVVRGYFKAFARNFKQATAFWLIALLLCFLLYIMYSSAAVNGGLMFQIYAVVTRMMIILYSLYFSFLFPLVATFENTFRKTAFNAFAMIIAHFPFAFLAYLCVALPFVFCFCLSPVILQITLTFWLLAGFSTVVYVASFSLNRIFIRYIKQAEEDLVE